MDINYIIEEYKNGRSANDIGKEFGKGHHFIMKLLVDRGVPLRPKAKSHIFKYYETNLECRGKKVYKTPNGLLFCLRPWGNLIRRYYVITVKCDYCGKETVVIKNRRVKKQYCSLKCKYKNMSGDKSYNWAGLRVMEKKYVKIYCPDHPFAKRGRILEHRLVMEKHINRYLDKDEDIHHINMDKTDNRIENLLLCKRSEHLKIHSSIDVLLKALMEKGLIIFDKNLRKYIINGEINE